VPSLILSRVLAELRLTIHKTRVAQGTLVLDVQLPDLSKLPIMTAILKRLGVPWVLVVAQVI
jgi:hypothetical protein